MNQFKNLYKSKFLNMTINYFCATYNGIYKSKVKDLPINKRKELYRQLYTN